MSHKNPLLTVDQLINQFTFEYAGHWKLCKPDRQGKEIDFTYQNHHAKGVYAYCIDGIVKYVGFTVCSFRMIFENCRKGNEGHKTYDRLHKDIDKALEENKRVETYVYITDDETEMKIMFDKIWNVYEISWRLTG